MDHLNKGRPLASTNSLKSISNFIFWTTCAFAITLAVVVKSEFSEELDEDDYGLEEREGRSMLAVPIVNQDCSGSNNNNNNNNNNMRNGVCVSASTCKRRGTRIGSCANGYGACCNIVANCTAGQQCPIRFNGTRISLSSTQMGRYRYVLNRPRGVSQVKLDFLPTTVLADPDDNDREGDCIREVITVTGSASIGNGGSLNVCGNLTDQHMYLDYGDADRISMNLLKTLTTSTVEIRVTYIRTNQRIVPASCLQYYTDTDNTIRSFGYPNQLNNQRYTICIESNSASDGSVELTLCPAAAVTNADQFFVTGGPNRLPPLIPVPCATDWIQVFGEDRQCGTTIPNNRIRMNQRPFMIAVNFDGTEFPPNVAIPVDRTMGTCRALSPDQDCYTCDNVMPICTCSTRPLETLADDDDRRRCQDAWDRDLGVIDSVNTGFCFNFNRV